MRRNDILIDKMEEIKILLQWFYMSENNKVEVKGKFANTLVWMNESLEFKAQNLMFEDLPEMDFTSTMTVPFMAGLIENLKKENAATFPNKFSSRWEEIKELALTNLWPNAENIKKKPKKAFFILCFVII